MQKIVAFIPNLFTLGNLFCGCLAIICCFNLKLDWAAYLVGIAAVLDFLDGFVARLLKVSGELGKQLDSLADAVTFGVVPGMIMYHLLLIACWNESVRELPYSIWAQSSDPVFPFLAMIIPVFSVYRLAKFNIDSRQTDSFIGLPTPANAILIAALGLIITQYLEGMVTYQELMIDGKATIVETPSFFNQFAETLLSEKFILLGITVVFSLLLVVELPLFALKFKNFGWSDNKIRYLFLTISLGLLIIFQTLAIPFIIVLYILISVINNLIAKP